MSKLSVIDLCSDEETDKDDSQGPVVDYIDDVEFLQFDSLVEMEFYSNRQSISYNDNCAFRGFDRPSHAFLEYFKSKVGSLVEEHTNNVEECVIVGGNTNVKPFIEIVCRTCGRHRFKTTKTENKVILIDSDDENTPISHVHYRKCASNRKRKSDAVTYIVDDMETEDEDVIEVPPVSARTNENGNKSQVVIEVPQVVGESTKNRSPLRDSTKVTPLEIVYVESDEDDTNHLEHSTSKQQQIRGLSFGQASQQSQPDMPPKVDGAISDVVRNIVDFVCRQEIFNSMSFPFDDTREKNVRSKQPFLPACQKEYCSKGCVCKSLNNSVMITRCTDSSCIFGCTCSFTRRTRNSTKFEHIPSANVERGGTACARIVKQPNKKQISEMVVPKMPVETVLESRKEKYFVRRFNANEKQFPVNNNTSVIISKDSSLPKTKNSTQLGKSNAHIPQAETNSKLRHSLYLPSHIFKKTKKKTPSSHKIDLNNGCVQKVHDSLGPPRRARRNTNPLVHRTNVPKEVVKPYSRTVNDNSSTTNSRAIELNGNSVQKFLHFKPLKGTMSNKNSLVHQTNVPSEQFSLTVYNNNSTHNSRAIELTGGSFQQVQHLPEPLKRAMSNENPLVRRTNLPRAIEPCGQTVTNTLSGLESKNEASRLETHVNDVSIDAPPPAFALTCLTPGIGYVTLLEFGCSILRVQDPFDPASAKTFTSVSLATDWLNYKLREKLNFDVANVDLKWLVASSVMIQRKKIKRFDTKVLLDPRCRITRHGVIFT